MEGHDAAVAIADIQKAEVGHPSRLGGVMPLGSSHVMLKVG